MEYDLVFEGGGAKGLAFVGAMQAFTEAGHSYRRLVGTSAGAITAVLLAAGYDVAELLAATSEKLPDGRARFASFMDTPVAFAEKAVQNSLSTAVFAQIDNPFLPDRLEARADKWIIDKLLQIPIYRNMFSFIEKGGWYAGDAFREWLTEKLNANGRDLGSTTLAEFQVKRPESELTVVAADTTGRERLILNHRTAPDLPVVWAVRMSMSIPFLWQEVVWQRQWKLYRNRDISGHTIVDGGALSNFAIDLLVSKDEDMRRLMGTTATERPVIGFLIDETLEVPGAAAAEVATTADKTASKVESKGQETIDRISRLVDTITNAHDKYIISAYLSRVCRLPAKGYGTTEFAMSDKRIAAIIAAGQQTMAQFLKIEAAPKRHSGRKRTKGSRASKKGKSD